MQQQDGLNEEVLDVRKAIEKNTSKVSLRDLEKKGFRQVKVLRAGDINQLIFKSVQNVLAKQPKSGMSEAERQRVMAEAKAELDQKMAEHKAIQRQHAELQQQKVDIEAAHQRLQERLEHVNAKLKAQRDAFEQEKAEFTAQKQSLFEKSLESQAIASKNYEGQLNELRGRLEASEQRAKEAEERTRQAEDQARQAQSQQSSQSQAAVQQAEQRAQEAEGKLGSLRERISRLEDELEKMEALRQQASQAAGAEARSTELKERLDKAEARADRYEQRSDELHSRASTAEARADRYQEEANEARARTEKAEGRVRELERLLEEARQAQPVVAGGGDPEEMARMRHELEQRDHKLKDLISGLANTMASAPAAPAEGGGDFAKQFASLQLSISDQIRKSVGGLKGAADMDLDISPEAAAAIFAHGSDIKMETNIKDVDMKVQKGPAVKDKLAKLRNLRKK